MAWISPTKPWALCSPARQAKLRTAWESGNLRWKLDPSQQRIYDDIYASHGKVKSSAERIYALDVSRQSGKDFLMSVIAIETCYRRRCPTRLPYGAPTKDTVHELLVPTIEAIFQDCPPDLLPHEIARGTFRTNSKELNWSWGARIVLVGVDLHPDWLRGPATYAFFLTEPGFIDNLDDLMRSVLLPQMLTQQAGFGIMASTPPVTPGHPWSQKYIPDAKARGMYALRTIRDCPRFSPEQVEGFIKELGGLESTQVRRELFCEHIVDSTLAIIPEWMELDEDKVSLKSKVVSEDAFKDPPAYRDTYLALDPGFDHATGGVFGYYDYTRNCFMLEGDFCERQRNSREVARYIHARKWQLWGVVPQKTKRMSEDAWQDELKLIRAKFYPGFDPPPKPVAAWRDGLVKHTTFRQVSDTDSRLIADMSTEHGIVLSPTDKDELSTAINSFRVNLQGLRYRVHPRCVNVITHLEQGTWNKTRSKFAESKDGGHFDTLSAMNYLNRSILWGRNPNPPHLADTRTHFVPKKGAMASAQGSVTAMSLSQVFARKRR